MCLKISVLKLFGTSLVFSTSIFLSNVFYKKIILPDKQRYHLIGTKEVRGKLNRRRRLAGIWILSCLIVYYHRETFGEHCR